MSQQIEQAWLRGIQTAANRNGRASLRSSSDRDQTQSSKCYTTRLLATASDGSMVIERPMGPGTARICQPKRKIDLLLMDLEPRLIAQCVVQGPMDYALNRNRNIHALQLSPAQKIWSGQRRQLYRVETTGCDLPPATLTPIGDTGLLRETDAFETALYDVSGGGLGLRISRRDEPARWTEIGQRFRCAFQLPGDEEPHEVETRLIRVEHIENRQLHLGLAFDLDDPITMRQLQDRLTRFTTELQRQALQRRA